MHNAQSVQPLPRGLLLRLPRALQRMVAEKDIIREYAPGQLIKALGETDDNIRYIFSGEASLVLRDDDGERIAVDTLGPGDIFGEVSFFTGLPWASDAELLANEPCRVLEIASEDFEAILRQEVDFTINLTKALTRKIMRLDRSLFKSKLNRRALQSLISREDHVFPDYFMGDYVWRRVAGKVEELAQTDAPVLIIGENGVGKEGVAHTLYRQSYQCKEVFLQVDLLGTSEGLQLVAAAETDPEKDRELTEKQLRLFFGWEEPAPDGGTKETPGYFELTDGGTLLVRGIEQLTATMQMRLLEAVVTDTFRRCGSVRLQRAKVRLFGTTRLDAAHITLERHPLLYGLLDRSVTIPPLRTRRKEIPGLVKRYVIRYSREMRRSAVSIPKETLRTLVNYAWPGNDLELATTLKRAVLVSHDGVLKPQDIYFHLTRIEGKGKFNLLRFRPVKQALMSPLFPAVFQSAATPFLFIIMFFLFLGPQDPLKNTAALISWALGWPVIIVGAFLWARFWCSLCPIGVVGNLAKKVFSLEKPFPPFLKNHSDFLIAGAVLFIIWMETATGIRNSPMILGLLLVAMMGSAIAVSMIYERQSWCTYVCGLGGMIAVWAKTSLLELRADRNVCIAECGSNECYVGTGTSEGCPFGNAGPKLHSNRLCTLCANCVKNCPHGAINLNLRVPGRELWEIKRPNTGTAFLVIGLIGGLLSEMSTKTEFFQTVTGMTEPHRVIGFSLVFLAVLALVNMMQLSAAAISRRVYGDSFEENYSRFGLALLPLTLASFMAFHLYYFVNLGVQIPILLSHNFDFEFLRSLIIKVPEHATRLVQMGLIWIGLVWTLFVMYQLARVSHKDSARDLLGALPHAILAVILALLMHHAMMSFFYAQPALFRSRLRRAQHRHSRRGTSRNKILWIPLWCGRGVCTMDFGVVGDISINLDFLGRLLSIIMIDLILAGDNAVVIAMAVRSLPREQRRKGIILGAGAAVLLRVGMTFFVSQLLLMSFVKLIGGALILWIAVKLFVEGAPEQGMQDGGTTISQAVKTIVIADISMSLDNMLAVGGASGGSILLLLFGLGLSIPFIVFTSNLLSTLMDRYPVIIYIGAAILGKVGGEMLITDPVIAGYFEPSKVAQYAIEALFAMGVIVVGKLVVRWKFGSEEAETDSDAPETDMSRSENIPKED